MIFFTSRKKLFSLLGMVTLLILSSCSTTQPSTDRDSEERETVTEAQPSERKEIAEEIVSEDESRAMILDEIRKEFPVYELPDVNEIRGGELLKGLHPEFKERIKFLYAVLESEGIEIVFISGHRPVDRAYLGNRLASWHNVGLAVDLNFVGRTYRYYPEDKEKWDRVGEIAMYKMGIIWGEMFNDRWHFEWHPGFNTRIRPHEAERLTALAGENLEDYPKTFSLFDPDLTAAQSPPPCFGGCANIPHEGLRALYDDVRTTE